MGNTNAPGLALLAASLMLFGSLAAIAWHEDEVREIRTSKKLTVSTFAIGSNTNSYSRSK